jgi:hypothetical protein
MKVEVQLIHLQAWAQAEISAQSQLLEVLKAMEKAVRSGRAEQLEESGADLENSMLGNRQREGKRSSLMLSMARHYGVPAGTLSLSSVIERAQAEGHVTEPLASLRDRLRARVQEVAQSSHLLTVMAKHHQGVLGDLMKIIGASSAEEQSRNNGVLMDAKA